MEQSEWDNLVDMAVDKAYRKLEKDSGYIDRLHAAAPEMLRLLKEEACASDKGWDGEVNALIARVEGKQWLTN